MQEENRVKQKKNGSGYEDMKCLNGQVCIEHVRHNIADDALLLASIKFLGQRKGHYSEYYSA